MGLPQVGKGEQTPRLQVTGAGPGPVALNSTTPTPNGQLKLSLSEYIESVFGPQKGDVKNLFVDDLRITTANNNENKPDVRVLLSALYSHGQAGIELKEHLREKGIKDFYSLRTNLKLRSGYREDTYELQSSSEASKEVTDWILRKSEVRQGINSLKMLKLLLDVINLKESTVQELLRDRSKLTREQLIEISSVIKKNTGITLNSESLKKRL